MSGTLVMQLRRTYYITVFIHTPMLLLCGLLGSMDGAYYYSLQQSKEERGERAVCNEAA